MIRTLITSTLVLSLMALAGCKTGKDKDGGMDGDKMMGGTQPVMIVDQIRGTDAKAVDQTVRLIKDQEDARDAGVTILANLPLDWETRDVVLLTLGEQETAGYQASITGIQREGDKLWVQGEAMAPAEDAMVAQVVTYPYAAAVIPEQGRITQIASDVESVQGE